MEPSKNPGQSKSHTATRTNPTTGEVETRVFTQEEWRRRDKSEGWTRPDDEGEVEVPESPTPTP